MNECYEVVKERNEKNKAFRKRLKTYSIIRIVWLGLTLLAMGLISVYVTSKTAALIGICVLGTIFIIWIVWCIIGGLKICCPHCNSYIGRSDPWHIPKCPYCGTGLEILQYYDREKL